MGDFIQTEPWAPMADPIANPIAISRALFINAFRTYRYSFGNGIITYAIIHKDLPGAPAASPMHSRPI